MKTFEELGVSEEIRRAITEMGFESPMPVQEEVIPYLLGIGNDVIALAQTGTGKTALLGAIKLIIGSRADASSVRDGEREAIVEALFSVSAEQERILPDGKDAAAWEAAYKKFTSLLK